MMRRVTINLLILGALLTGALSLSAQGTPADTVLQRAVRKQLDSLARDKTAPLYSRRAQARIDSLLANHLRGIVVPPPPPPPVDSAPVVVAQDTALAELPRVYVNTTYPTIARRYQIGNNVQAALDTARAGDELVLTGGATYTGNLTWTRCLTAPVVLTGPSGPTEGARATPALAASYPKLVTPNTSPALLARSGSCGLRVSRVEITHAPPAGSTVTYNYGLVRAGEGELTVDLQPRDIVLDRVYIHGSAATSTQNAFIVNGRAIALVDSWADQVRWKGVEAHCVIGWQGQGPIKLVNNHFDCASIDVLFGGAARAIAGVQPSDIEVRGNHFTKDTSYVGYVAKNLFELKDARRVLLEGNVIEHSWFEAQSAMAVNLQSLTDEGNTAVQTFDVTVRWNRIEHAGQCITLSARGYNNVASPMGKVLIENNLCTDIGVDSINRVLLMTADIQGVTIRKNTLLRNALPRKMSVTYLQRGSGSQASRVDITDNVIGPGLDYPCVFGEGKSGTAALTNYAALWTFTGNSCFDSHPGATAFPPGNTFTDTMPTTGGVDQAELARRLAGVVVLP